MKNNKTITSIAIIALIMGILCLSVGYAAFSGSLNITSTLYARSYNWDISFDDVDTGIMYGSARETKAPIIGHTSVNLFLEFLYPGDSATYYFDVANYGDLDAVLSRISVSDDCGDGVGFTYELTYANGNPLVIGERLLSGENERLKLVISLDENCTIERDKEYNMEFILLYSQA